ncbi:hydrolase [Streptomyces sp. NBC_00178]|uniref:hydrolase n=1 Tax=Streptomyces sp. NBC_00178 TaxID=2975672 RepID=UPI002E2C1C43|nr:hydrolase [Streptomyces sp. NBC_00178]
MPDSPSDAPALLLSGARLADGRSVDVRISGPRIEAVGTAGSLRTEGRRLDLRGYLLLPAPAEPHAHPGTALTAGGPAAHHPAPDHSGSHHPASGHPTSGHSASHHPAPDHPASGHSASGHSEDVRRRTTESALLQLSHGATALRAHVRVGDSQGPGALEAVLEAGRSLRGLTDLTTVAVPRVLTGVAGKDGLARLRDAVEMGAGVIGACPDLDPDPAGHVEAVLDLAATHDRPVDLHTDGDDPARLAGLADMAGGLGSRVCLGPVAGLARLPDEVAARTADRLAAAAVTVVCLPQGPCSGSLRRGTAPVRLLRAAGVRVAAGSGALRDASNPVGRGDPLEAAYLLASQHGLTPQQAYDAVSTTARAALGLPGVRVEAGFPAELLAVRGDGLAGALSLAYSRIVVHRGRVVARTSAVREYRDSGAASGLDLPRQGRVDSGHGGGP